MSRWALVAFAALSFVGVGAQAAEPAATSPKAVHPAWTKKLFFGGGIGLTFGSASSVYIAPLVGYHVIPRVDVGIQPFYRYADYDLYGTKTKTHDYGTDLFARVHLVARVFAEGRYEWISHEYVQSGTATARRSDSLWMAGAGYSVAAGPASIYVSALYTFSYDENDPYRAYDSPWIVQAGVVVGF